MADQNAVAKVDLRVSRNGIRPRNMPELWRMAEMMVKGGIAPKGTTTEGACAIMAFGMELGLSPIQSLRDICFINGRPSAFGDGVSALLNASGLLASAPEVCYAGAGDQLACTVILRRRGLAGEFKGHFSMAMAKRAGLTRNDTYTKHPERMIYWRAYTYAARDGFSDVLKGLTTAEEAMDLPPVEQVAQVLSSRPVPSPVPAAPFDGVDQSAEEAAVALEEEIASAVPVEAEAPPAAPAAAPAPTRAPAPPPANGNGAAWKAWSEIRGRLIADQIADIKKQTGLEWINVKTPAEALDRAVILAREMLGV